MSSRRLIAQNTLAQLVGKTINTVSSLLITILIGRFLGDTFYGDFTKVFATTTFLFMVLDFGFNATIVKAITQNPKATTVKFQNLLGLRLLVSLVLYIFLLTTLFILPSPSNQGYTSLVKLSIAVFALQYFAQAIFLSCNAVFQSRLDYVRSVIASSAGSLIQLLLVAVLVTSQTSLLAITTVHLLGSIVIAAIALLLIRRYVTSVFPRANVLELKPLITRTAPIGIALVLNLFATHSDTIILTFLRPTPEVGYYGLSRRIFDVFLVFPTFFMNATYPILLQKFELKNQALKQVFKKALRILAIVGLLASLTLIISAPALTIIRPEFSPAVTTIRILSFSLPIFFITNLLMWTTIAVGKERRLSYVYGIALLVNLVGNLSAIPRFGGSGAAVVTVVTEMVVLLLLLKPIKHLTSNESQ